MKTHYPHLWSFLKFQPVDTSRINTIGLVYLLEMTYTRMRISTSVMMVVVIPFLWAHIQQSNQLTFVCWALFYLMLIVMIWWPYRRFLQEKHSLDALQFLKKWEPKIELIAVLHGAGLSLSVLMALNLANYAFLVLMLVVIGHLQLIDVKYKPNFWGSFLRYLSIGCNPVLLLIPWVFPQQWMLILPLTLLYSLLIYRHSTKAIQFNVNQILLEQEHQALAENYKLAKIEAEAALQAKNQFLTTASHDLRQPVHAMGFLIESIAHRNQDTSLIPALNDLKQSVRSVTQMFNSLLDLSKIEAGAVQLNVEKLPLNRLVHDIALLFAEEARSRNLTLRVKLAKHHAVVSADATLLRQSLVNMMHNALRYTKQGGVLIAVRKRSKTWQLEVWDTGIGIAVEDQHQVYSPFFRHEHAWRIDSAGHGLGLAVVARCCDLMDIRYGLSSQLGRGSRFWLQLPFAEGSHYAACDIEAVVDTTSLPLQQVLSGKCLIIDDDPLVTIAWQSLLSTWGVDTRCAASGNEALRVLASGFIPAAIFCDQRLRAGESGFDILRMLLERCPAAHGAMISGEFNSPELLEAEDEGYLVLHKPLEPEVLLALLSRWFIKSAQ